MRFDTDAVHGGYDSEKDKQYRRAIYLDVAPAQPDCKTVADIFSGRIEGFVYGRFGNPNAAIVEKKIALLEGAEDAKSFSTGLAAINCLLLSLTKPGDNIVAQRRLYGGTFQSLAEDFIDAGRKVTFVDNINDSEELRPAITKKTKILYGEILSNPTQEVLDCNPFVKTAKKFNLKSIIDSTFATPALFRPLEYGADLVVHSATKYMGFGANMGGIVAGSAEDIRKVKERAKRYGAPLLPLDAFFATLGLETMFRDRLIRQSDSALKVAKFLDKHPRVKKVYYPKLMSSPEYFRAKEYLPDGAGAVVPLEINGSREDTICFVESLKIFSTKVNLGEITSLAIIPAESTHFSLSPENLLKAGISETFVRLSCGLENPDDLIEDLEQALRKIEN